MKPLRRVLYHYSRFKPFSAEEAWVLFKLAALTEAVGWTLLIIGVTCQSLPVSWHEVPVQLAGRIHGMLFLTYIVAVLVLSPSLRWSLPRTLIAGLFSVPPYGSLAYEQWSVRYQDWHRFKELYSLAHYSRITGNI